MKKNKKFSFFIFDLDGVIFDSKKNMMFSWKETCKKFYLKIGFSSYFKRIGLPFNKILISLGIDPKKEIFETYKKASIKNMKFIKKYEGVTEILRVLKNKKIKFSIVTSKDLKRSKYLLNKYNIKPASIHCPNIKLRGKPYPDQILSSLKKNNIKPKNACYVGDTEFDYLASKRAKIEFIFAKYGYGIDKKYYNNKIKNIKDLKKFL